VAGALAWKTTPSTVTVELLLTVVPLRAPTVPVELALALPTFIPQSCFRVVLPEPFFFAAADVVVDVLATAVVAVEVCAPVEVPCIAFRFNSCN